MKKYKQYEIKKTISLQEALENIKSNYNIATRYLVYIYKGFNCASCDRKASFARLERHKKSTSKRNHYNFYCNDGMMMTVDHIVPRSKGGINKLSNMQPMCENCNSKKSDNML